MAKRPAARSKKKEPAKKTLLKVREPSEEELDAAWTGPAVYCNRFYINVGPSVRIAFCEQGGEKSKPLFRAAVVMGHQDAIALANLLKQMLAEIEVEIEKAIGQAASQESKNA